MDETDSTTFSVVSSDILSSGSLSGQPLLLSAGREAGRAMSFLLEALAALICLVCDHQALIPISGILYFFRTKPRVLPGHGPLPLSEREKRHNPLFELTRSEHNALHCPFSWIPRFYRRNRSHPLRRAFSRSFSGTVTRKKRGGSKESIVLPRLVPLYMELRPRTH